MAAGLEKNLLSRISSPNYHWRTYFIFYNIVTVIQLNVVKLNLGYTCHNTNILYFSTEWVMDSSILLSFKINTTNIFNLNSICATLYE